MDYKVFLQKNLWAINLLLIFGVCYLSAGAVSSFMVTRYLEPKSSAVAVGGKAKAEPQALAYSADVDKIMNRDLFKVKPPKVDENAEGSDQENSMEETTLRLKLFAVYYRTLGSDNNMATIQNIQAKKTDVYRIGDTLDVGESVTVSDILPTKAELTRANGNKEWLTLEEEKEKASNNKAKDGLRPGEKAPSDLYGMKDKDRQKMLDDKRKFFNIDDKKDKMKWTGPNQMEISRDTIDDALGDLNKIITQARVTPNYVGEGEEKQMKGFKIFRIQPSSIFEALGLNNGDVIMNINSNELNNFEQAIQLLSTLRTERHFSIDLNRGGNPLTITYDVK